MEDDLSAVSDLKKLAKTSNPDQSAKEKSLNEQMKQSSNSENSPRWIDNNGEEVEQVFGFNNNAELVNGRTAMFGFLMLILTEIVFHGEPVTKSIFGIN